jgi:hypothetical protein
VRAKHPKFPIHRSGRPDRKARWLGRAGGLIAQLSKPPLPAVTRADLKKQDYSTSTQRLGVRFTERVRDVFRFRWIREIF